MVVLNNAVYLLSLAAAGVAADPIDWVNINYVVKQGKSNGATTNAQGNIASKAGGTAQKGPWTIGTKGINPPSGDARDYLSWAPYHWPDCNWCSKGSTHYINSNDTYDEPSDEGDGPNGDGDYPDDSTDYPNSNTDYDPDYPDSPDDNTTETSQNAADVEDLKNEIAAVNFAVKLPIRRGPSTQLFEHRMKRVHRTVTRRGCAKVYRRQEDEILSGSATSDLSVDGTSASAADTPSVPTAPPSEPNVPQITGFLPTTSTSNRVAGTQAPAQAPAKTQDGQSGCTPSPTKSLAPSATWTTCPYVVRDGQVNPDTNGLKGPDATQDMSQSVIYNAVAFALQQTAGYSQNVAKAIDAFFLSSSTGMNPNVNFGQLVRGPGKDHQVGTFTGILDLRGMVKVSNAIQLMRSAKAPDWTSARDTSMTNWMKTYISWLQTSNLGKSVASKANNHLTFYVAQVAAVKIALGDGKGAGDTLQKYFSSQFLDQIAQSGEQPFESVRTRPYHYRCFNLEAMIANAKMGDQLGLNLWAAKSKYGATIQTALDYVMGVNPKSEDMSDIFPHVAAVAAAYGDPKGKYAAFLQKNDPNYQSQPFWFYDQSAALPNSPAGKTKRSDESQDPAFAEGSSTAGNPSFGVTYNPWTNSSASRDMPSSDVGSSVDGSTAPVEVAGAAIPFECPAVFRDATFTELEDDLFVTCDQLKRFYEIPLPVNSDAAT
ncbi:alginate lyase-domain-containing protein [Cytidiella melzeri]|nr:alginate lyase-domain-containing protein [Cytidiella melzeri]